MSKKDLMPFWQNLYTIENYDTRKIDKLKEKIDYFFCYMVCLLFLALVCIIPLIAFGVIQWYVIIPIVLAPSLALTLKCFTDKKWIGQKKQRLVQIQIKMNEYNDLHLKARNMRLELQEKGLWMCLVFISGKAIGLGTENHAHGLWLPPYPPTNAYPAYPEFEDPSGFKDQPEPIYGTAIPCEPFMP